MEISIIVPCAIDDGIERCVRSIDEPTDIIAVLNRPTHAARATVARLGLRFIEVQERNLGLACDVGVAAAEHDLVMLMNSDCWFEPGAVRAIHGAWAEGLVVTTPVRYEGAGLSARLVEGLQASQSETPPHAYQPGLLFDRRIRDQIGGYWFDHDIHWTEDADFHRRVVAASLRIRLAPAVIWHRQPSIASHLRSAFRYGIGRRIAEEKGLPGTSPFSRWSPRLAYEQFSDRRRENGVVAGAYATVWFTVFSFGVAWQRLRDVYGTRARLGVSDSR